MLFRRLGLVLILWLCGLTAALAIEAMRMLGLPWPAALAAGGLGYAALLVATGIVRPREWLFILRGRPPLAPEGGVPRPIRP